MLARLAGEHEKRAIQVSLGEGLDEEGDVLSALEAADVEHVWSIQAVAPAGTLSKLVGHRRMEPPVGGFRDDDHAFNRNVEVAHDIALGMPARRDDARSSPSRNPVVQLRLRTSEGERPAGALRERLIDRVVECQDRGAWPIPWQAEVERAMQYLDPVFSAGAWEPSLLPSIVGHTRRDSLTTARREQPGSVHLGERRVRIQRDVQPVGSESLCQVDRVAVPAADGWRGQVPRVET